MDFKTVVTLLYVVFGTFGIGYIISWIRESQRNKDRLSEFESEAAIDKALKEATKSIKNLNDDDLDKLLRKDLDGDGDTH